MSKESKYYSFVKSLAAVGVLLSVYLLWEQLAKPSFQPCNINETINCNAVISGAVSKTLGIPTPLYGLVGYIVILVAAILKKKKLLFATSTFGLVFCLWIAYNELFLLHTICPVCLACQVVIISVFILSFLILGGKEVPKPEVQSSENSQ